MTVKSFNVLLLLTLGSIAAAHAQTSGPAGTAEKIKVHGASLEGNLEGDPAERDVFVYLPPSYASQPNRRYPVVYHVGDMDNLMPSNKQMDESLARLGVTHTFEIYEGNHGNRVKERFETKVLPFFSANLKSQAQPGARK